MHSQTVPSAELDIQPCHPTAESSFERSTTKAPSEPSRCRRYDLNNRWLVQNSSGWYAIIILVVLASPSTLLSYSIQRAKPFCSTWCFIRLASFELVQFGWEFGRDNTWMWSRVLVYVHPHRSVCVEEPVWILCSNTVADEIHRCGGCCESEHRRIIPVCDRYKSFLLNARFYCTMDYEEIINLLLMSYLNAFTIAIRLATMPVNVYHRLD